MDIYYDESSNMYHTSFEEGVDFSALRLIKKEMISKAAYEELAPETAADFVTVLAMLEQCGTSLECVIEDWQNGDRFICNDYLWVRGINTIPQLFEALREHAVYFRTEKDFIEFVAHYGGQ